MTSKPVIVTRPAREAARWVDDLRAAGFDAVALPLIEIAPLGDPAPVDAAWRRISGYDALMFVSAAAAAHFFASTQARPDAAAHCRFWATGPGTARALRDAGVAASSIDAPSADAASFDSEALWLLVRAQVSAGARVLIVRGGDAAGQPAGREWLAREIAEAGGHCDAVAAYRRLVPALGDEAVRTLRGAADGSAIWLFSSSEAISNLRALAPAIEWQAACAIATHERIAQAARRAGFGRVRVSPPSLSALSALIASVKSYK
jgi:uroporphyrinogen-III synthase